MQTSHYHAVMPKSTNYQTDGTGRDSYILVNNGGNYCSFLKTPGLKRGVVRPVTLSPPIQSRSVHYNADGSGRDGYVKTGDGGLHPHVQGCSFQNSLRVYQVHSSPFLRTTGTWLTQNARSVLRTRSRLVQNCIRRLSPSK